jgi:Bacterial Ig-like domain
MAENEIDPNDRETVRKVLSTKIRNYFLIFVGVAVLITGYFLVSGGAGSLFQGSIFPTIPGSEFPPTIVSRTPDSGATNMPTASGQFLIVFDEDSLVFDPNLDITILKSGSTADKQVGPTSYQDKVLTINYADLEGSTAYTLTVPDATISNGTEPMDSPLVITFTSGTAPVDDDDDDDDSANDDDDTANDDDDTSDDDDDDDDTALEIEDHSVFPAQFNPLTNDTKISYEITADAKIDIKIIDHTGVTVYELLSDEDVEAGDYYVWWDGTDGSEVVASGDYQYKIYAKDPGDDEVMDIKSGEVKALYASIEDFEDVVESEQNNQEPVVTSVTTTTTSSQSQAAATIALQSAETGVTAETGPPVLIYLLFPLGGLFLSRKKQ